MIKFFRKIRQNLLSEGKTGKYLKYALGEIILVVIGILIALQLNNWNESQKTENTEQAYLTSLKEEVIYNIGELEKVMAINENNAENALKLLEYTGNDVPEISGKECNLLIANTLIWEVQFRPSTGVYDEIISSGKLGIFSNSELRQMLASWDGLMLKIRFQEEEHGNLRNNALNLIHDKGNVRVIFHQEFSEDFSMTPSNFEKGNLGLLKDQEFENQISSFYMTAKVMNRAYYAQLKENMESLLQVLNKELNKNQEA